MFHADRAGADAIRATSAAVRNIAVLGFERLASTFDTREGYVLWVRALRGSSHPQVRAYRADAS